MREIKFRAWDKDSKKMVIDFEIMSSDGEPFDVGGYAKPEWILMQFTGLKDKNGKEIYGGDICKIHIFTEELGENMGVVEGEHEFVAEIKLDNISAGVMLENGNGDSGPIWAYGGMHEESFEVIGNIYENPELLKGAEGPKE